MRGVKFVDLSRDLILVVDESGSEGNAGGFSTEDDVRFCHLNSFSLSISISPYISLYGGGRRRGGLVLPSQ
uniref:Uncharacterized protein n=1 Tax=Fagus sylvatica TaxID=28930 RepID=A0A2N9EKK7_FAGSY